MSADANDLPEYWAFVSYSHHDSRVAKWLAESLAKERVPHAFRDWIKGSPNRFAPLFRDEDELGASSSLSDALKAKLAVSRNLIVICSPSAAASRYVADEIRHFIALGRAERILCLIASGVPNATDAGDPSIECFPAPLRFRIGDDGALSNELVPLDQRPLAATMGAETADEQSLALRQIKSGLLGISQSELERHLSRRRLLMGGITAAAVILTSGIAYVGWDNFLAEHVSYYRNYTRRWGVWEGVDEIDKQAAARLPSSYAFVSQGRHGRPSIIRKENGAGQCAAEGIESITGVTQGRECTTSRACTAQIKYSAGGDVEREALIDQFGHEIESFHYLGPNTATFVYAQFPCSQGPSGIALLRFEHDKQGPSAGFDRQVSYMSLDRQARPNEAKSYGRRMTYDALGRIVEETELGPSGESWVNSSWFASRRVKHDDRGNAISVSFFGTDGKPAIVKDGYAGWRAIFDGEGREVERSFFGVEGDAILTADGLAGWRSKFDERGNAIEISFFGVDGKPIVAKNGFAGTRSRFDKQGNEVETTFVGIDGAPVYSNYGLRTWQGSAGWRAKFDEHRNEFERIFVGIDGKPTLRSRIGVAGVRSKFDERGNIIETTYLSIDGNPTMRKEQGWAVMRFQFDERGNKTKSSWLGVDGRPVLSKYGVSGWREKHDDRGNTVEELGFGIAGEPIVGADGYVGWRSRFDERGNEIETSYFGLDGKPALSIDGFSSRRTSYDEHGNGLETSYFDTLGKPIKGKDGAAGWRSKFDERGHEIETSYFGPDGKPTMIEGGYASKRSTFDDRGNKIEESYFGVGGKPANTTGCVATERSSFDAVGHLLELRQFDQRGRLTENCKTGAAIVVNEYDASWRLVKENLFDRYHHVVQHLKEGWAYRTSTYASGKPEVHYFDKNGAAISASH